MTSGHPQQEKELLSLIAAGDVYAYGELFDLWSKHVYMLSLKLTKDAALAEDLTQDIFAKLWQNREKLAGVYHFKGYLNTVSRNLIRNYLNKKVWTEANDALLQAYFKESADPVHEGLEYKEVATAIREAIDQLPPQLKTVFTLSRVEGLSHEQIASQLQLSKVTVKSYIVRSLVLIRGYLGRHYPILLHILAVMLSRG